ncbi:MAG: nucleoside triphosphate pyrophosphohydrolase [Porticoccus sp.]|jgi:ATP diphosphatase|nr:nucleoside triphosphate pyrophosphohydrolase [Porticoccus sp.]
MPNKKFSINDLVFLMKRLRDPISGCPWDAKQTFKSITPYTLEEVHEVIDAIETGNFLHLKEELGDLLFQIIFYCRLAEEEGYFGFNDVISSLAIKLINRHPHVFPDGTLQSKPSNSKKILTTSDIKKQWEEIKSTERERKGQDSVLADISATLPSLMRAQKIQKRTASVGFDWNTTEEIFKKIDEGKIELQEAISADDTDSISEELGDLMFTIVNLCRYLDIDAEISLRAASNKFETRFNYVETKLRESKQEGSYVDADSLDSLWRQVKKKN